MSKDGKTDKWAARSVRLSAALRENLKRRKEQARARMRDEARGEDPGPKPSKQETGHEAVPDTPPGAVKTSP